MSDFESLLSSFIPFGMFIMVGIFIWGVFDTTFLLKRTGNIKRGVKIWSEPLSEATRDFFENLSEDIVEERKHLFLPSMVVGFIIAKNGEVLVQYRRKNWRTSWPYVGYIDLRKANLRIEYRASLPMHLFLLPFVLTIVAIPFVGLLMGVNFFQERNAILDFVHKQVIESDNISVM